MLAEGGKIERAGEQSNVMLVSSEHEHSKAKLTVTPLWPPTTGTDTDEDNERLPRISETKVEARTTSSVVTPKILIMAY
jgi:hypothetical protein